MQLHFHQLHYEQLRFTPKDAYKERKEHKGVLFGIDPVDSELKCVVTGELDMVGNAFSEGSGLPDATRPTTTRPVANDAP